MFAKLKAIKWKDVFIRALKTFVEAFVGAVAVNRMFGAADWGTFKSILTETALAGISAGVCAVWNMMICALKKQEGSYNGKTEDDQKGN